MELHVSPHDSPSTITSVQGCATPLLCSAASSRWRRESRSFGQRRRRERCGARGLPHDRLGVGGIAVEPEQVEVRLYTRVVGGRGDNRLESLTLQGRPRVKQEEVAAAAVFIMIGAKPHTDWLAPVLSLDKNGFVLTGRDIPGAHLVLEHEPYPFETSRPGVFAAGDVRHGSVKRVAGAVGEGSEAVGSVHAA
jgi:Pyridine nucleotide-disulphide oxidoreductase